MKSFVLTTKPASVNSMYRGRRFLTSLGKATKESMMWEIKTQHKTPPITTPVALNILFYFKNSRMDIDNALKALLDCMTGLVYEDDSLIEELHVFKMVDKENPRIEVQVL